MEGFEASARLEAGRNEDLAQRSLIRAPHMILGRLCRALWQNFPFDRRDRLACRATMPFRFRCLRLDEPE